MLFATETDLFVKMIPESVIASGILLVVYMFLRHEKERTAEIKEMSRVFTEKVEAVTRTFQQQVTQLVDQNHQRDVEKQKQIEKLFDNFMSISKETINAVVDLKSSVEGLGKKIDRITTQPKHPQLPDKS